MQIFGYDNQTDLAWCNDSKPESIMADQVWKEFEENQLTHSAAHYLMTIEDLLSEHGYARVTDVAKRLNITRGSTSISLKPLKRRGLVLEDENKFPRLSEEGLRMAELVQRNDELLQVLFRDVLGVDPDQSEIDACKIEHLLSLQTSTKLAAFIDCVLSGTESVKGFLKDIKAHEMKCTHDADHCSLCSNVCFLDHVESTGS